MYPQTLDYIKALLKANQSTGSLCKRTTHWNTSSTQLFSSVQFLYPGVVYPLQDLVVPFYLSWPRLKKQRRIRHWSHEDTLFHCMSFATKMIYQYCFLYWKEQPWLEVWGLCPSLAQHLALLEVYVTQLSHLDLCQNKEKASVASLRKESDTGRAFLPHSQTL